MTVRPGQPVTIDAAIRQRLMDTVLRRHPIKSFGYLVSGDDWCHVSDFACFDDNVRNAAEWQPRFHEYGTYFVDHDDAGFVATPEETWRVQRDLEERGLFEVGLFHTHQRHPPNFSRIDYELHMQGFEALWHMIISLRNPRMPQLRVFSVSADGVREVPLVVRHEEVPAR